VDHREVAGEESLSQLDGGDVASLALVSIAVVRMLYFVAEVKDRVRPEAAVARIGTVFTSGTHHDVCGSGADRAILGLSGWLAGWYSNDDSLLLAANYR